MGHHAMTPWYGAAKAVSHGVQSITERLPQCNPGRQIVGETVASDDAALRQREADYQARVPDSMASYAGAAAGEVVPFAVGAPARLLQATGAKVGGLLSKAPKLVQRIGSGVAQGGLLGLTQPVLDEGSGSGKLPQVGVGAGTGGLLIGKAWCGERVWW